MKRRNLLAAGAASLAMPGLAVLGVVRAQGTARGQSSLLKFIPQSDLTVLDPHWTTAYVTRNHGFMVFDTLYGTNGKPMSRARRWWPAIRWRADGTAVAADFAGRPASSMTARRCWRGIAWRASSAGAKKDGFGQALLAATDDLSRRTATR